MTSFPTGITIIVCGSRSMVEHQLPKLAFAGSIPVSRSKRELAVTSVTAFSFLQSRELEIGYARKKKCTCKARASGDWKHTTPCRCREYPAGNITVINILKHFCADAGFRFEAGDGNRIGSHERSECFAEQSEKAMMPFQRVGPHRRGFPSIHFNSLHSLMRVK